MSRPTFATRAFVAGLLLTIPGTAQWSKPQQEWALATSALLTQMRGERHDFLAGAEDRSSVAERDRGTLSSTWEINSRDDLLKTIRNLLADDSDAHRIGWNYPRVVSLARWGYGAGYLIESEAWAFIMPAAQRLQQTFRSWQELGLAYLQGRLAWFADSVPERRPIEYAYRALVLEPSSPWRKYPWNLDIGGSRPIQVQIEKSASVIFAPHRDGLICVQLRIPDHTVEAAQKDALYMGAIEKAVGCRPRATGSRRLGSDWILDTECHDINTLHGVEVMARLRPDGIAAQLKREGVTQLFVYVQHELYGESRLAPPAYDNWVDGGLQWYLFDRSLKTPLPEMTLTYGSPSSRF